MKISEQAEATIDWLLARGWRNDGRPGQIQGPNCISQAWYYSGGMVNWVIPSRYQVPALGTNQLINWNDYLAEDIHEVIASLLTIHNLAIADGN